MEDLFYVVKTDFCYDEFDSTGEEVTVFRTGDALKDRQDAIDYIKAKVNEYENLLYKLDFVEEIDNNKYQCVTLIKTEEVGSNSVFWVEKEVSHLHREIDLFEKRSLISESNIRVIGNYRFIDGIQVLFEDYIGSCNIRDLLFRAVENQDLGFIKRVLANIGNWNLNMLLLKACEAGNLKIAKLCISQKADVNYLDSLPLYHAIYSGNDELVAYLISEGANWARNKEDMINCATGVGLPWKLHLSVGPSNSSWKNCTDMLKIAAIINPPKN